MHPSLAQAEPVFLLSVAKPVITLVLLGGWAWVVMKLDKDAGYFYLPRPAINGGLLAVGALAFLLLLAIPVYFLGLVLFLLLTVGSFFGYAFYRNTQVPPDRKWSFNLDSFRAKVEDLQQSQAASRASVRVLGPGDQPLTIPRTNEPAYPAYAQFDEMLYHALRRRAQRLTLKVSPKDAETRYRIDGVSYPGPELEPALALQIVDFVKGVARLDVSDRRKKQTGKLKAESEEAGLHNLELTTSGSTRGLTLTVDVDLDRRHDFSFEQLGLLATQRQQLDRVLDQKGGVVIVTGSPGQGKSTTLYRLLERHDPYVQGVSAMELDPSLELEGVAMERLEPGLASQALHEKIASKLRSDPDVLLLDFEPGKQTAQLLAKSADDIRFYLDFDQPSAMAGLSRWVSLVGDRKLAGESVVAVINLRLVRRLCPTCRIAYKPAPEALKKLGLPADKVDKLHRASGKVEIKGKPATCPECHGIGYRGRVAVYEVLALDRQAQTFVAAGEIDQLKGHLRKQKTMYLQEAALARVVEGVTDVKELSRALDTSGKSPSAPRPSSADAA